MQRDEAYLLDIFLAAKTVSEYAEGMSWEQFLEDRKTQDAILHEIMIMGEASRRTSVAFRLKHQTLPWPKMIGMRNVIVHEYEVVELELIWDVIQNHLPPLIAQIQPLLPTEE